MSEWYWSVFTVRPDYWYKAQTWRHTRYECFTFGSHTGSEPLTRCLPNRIIKSDFTAQQFETWRSVWLDSSQQGRVQEGNPQRYEWNMADNSGDKQNSLFVVKWKYTHRSGTSGTGCAPAVRSRPQPAGCWSLRQSTVEIRRSGYIQLNFISKSSFRRKSQNGHWMRTSHTGCEKLCSGCPWPSLRSAKWSSKVRSADIFIWSTERTPCCNKTSIYCSLFDSFRFPVAQGKLDFNSAQTK